MPSVASFILALLIAVISYILPNSLFSFLLLGALVFIVCLVNIDVGLLVLIFIMGRLKYIQVSHFFIYRMEVVFAAFFVAFLIAACTRRVRIVLKTPLSIPFAFFITSMLISYLFCRHDARAFTVWLGLLLIYLIVVSLVERPQQLRLVVYSLLFVGSAFSLFGLYQHFAGVDAPCNRFHQDFVVNEEFIRAYSVFGHPNHFAAYLNLVIPLAFTLFIYEKARKSIVAGAAFFVSFAAITATTSRTALVACVLGLCMLSGIIIKEKCPEKMKRLAAAWLIIVIATVPFFMNGSLQKRFQGISAQSVKTLIYGEKIIFQEDPNYGFAQRFLGVQLAYQIIKDHPIRGLGVGEYRRQSKNYPVKNLEELTYDTFIHNILLHIWIEAGIVALIAFVIALVVYVRHCLRLLRRSFWVKACFGSFVAYFLNSMFDCPIYDGITLILGIILAVPFVVERMKE